MDGGEEGKSEHQADVGLTGGARWAEQGGSFYAPDSQRRHCRYMVYP